MLSAPYKPFMLSVTYAEYPILDLYGVCHHAECRYAECRGAKYKALSTKLFWHKLFNIFHELMAISVYCTPKIQSDVNVKRHICT